MADVKTVIIGAGIIGVSVAAYLARRGIVEDVYLLEEGERPGGGETAASASMLMCNTHTNDPTLIRLAAAAKQRYDHFEEKFGFDPEIQRCGSLLVSVTPEGADRMKNQIQLQRENGINSQFLSLAEIQRQFPYLRGEDIQAGIWCPDDGYVDQMRLTEKLWNYARNQGIQTLLNTRVTGLQNNTEGIGIDTEKRGSLTTDKIIIAAGGHSPKLVHQLGYNLPLIYSTRTLCTGVINQFYSDPSIVEFVDGPDEGFYIRPIKENSIMVAVGPTQDSNVDPGREVPSFGKDLAGDFIARRFPEFEMEDGGLIGNPGTRSMVRDGLPYLGPLDGGRRINVAYGASGYGMTLAPFFGEEGTRLLVEERISGEFQSALAPDRFYGHRTVEGW